jgi:MFS transporter, AAHS family, 4-hydroxybenzoate transporter
VIWESRAREKSAKVVLGRIGSIVGPLVGAQFVGLPVHEIYMWSALPFAVGAIVCFIVHRLNAARLAARPELREAQ